MTRKMLDSTQPGMTRSSSHLASMYGKDFLELVWENGYPTINSSHKEEATGITKRTRLNTLWSLLDHFSPHRDSDLSSTHSHQTNDQDSCQIDLQFSQNSESFNKLKEEFANKRQVKESKLTEGPHHLTTSTAENCSHLCTYSSQQCLPSSPLKKPRMDSSQGPAANSQKLQYLGCDQRTEKVNFSNFLPAVLLKSTNQPLRNASLARLGEIEADKVEKAAVAVAANSISKAPDHSIVIESAKGSNVLTGFRDQQTSLTAKKSNPASLVARSVEEPPLDENSEAVDHNSATLREKGKANNNLCNEPLLASFPVCSLGASNDPNFCIRKHENTDHDSTYFSDNDEEQEDVVVKETPAQEGNSVKRSRNAEAHHLYERKLNKKMRILKELIPNCNKMDKASLLDDAIDYLKTLKHQLQVMSMGSGLCMPQMMLPAAMHHITAPNLPQLMGAGMGFTPSTSIIPCRPPQFPIPSLSGITDNTLQMFGNFSNQMPSIPIPHAPNFIPMVIGNTSTQPLMATGTATNLAEHFAKSSQLTTLEASIPEKSYLHAKAELCAANQEANQVSLNHSPNYPFCFPTNKEGENNGKEGKAKKM